MNGTYISKSISVLGRWQPDAFRPGARFAGLLGPDTIGEIARLRSVRFERLYTAGLVLYAWLGQAAGPDKTCRCAVLRLVTVLRLLGREACSTATGGFCRARAKLSLAFVRVLTLQLGEQVEAAALPEWLYKGRRVLLADGTPMAGKTPERVEADLWVHLLHYNLVRRTMAQATQDKGWEPRDVKLSRRRRGC